MWVLIVLICWLVIQRGHSAIHFQNRDDLRSQPITWEVDHQYVAIHAEFVRFAFFVVVSSIISCSYLPLTGPKFI